MHRETGVIHITIEAILLQQDPPFKWMFAINEDGILLSNTVLSLSGKTVFQLNYYGTCDVISIISTQIDVNKRIRKVWLMMSPATLKYTEMITNSKSFDNLPQEAKDEYMQDVLGMKISEHEFIVPIAGAKQYLSTQITGRTDGLK